MLVGYMDEPSVSFISDTEYHQAVPKMEESVVTDFLEHSTVHGLKQLSHPENGLPKKLFWTFVLVGCFIGGSYEIYQVVSYYRLNPSATQVSWTLQSEYEFPPMAFCPKRWLHIKRTEELGLKEDALAYLISFLQPDANVSSGFEEAKALDELGLLMIRSGITGFAELIKNVAYDERGLLRVIATPSNLTLAPAIIEGGLCYIIKVAPLKSGMLRTNVMLKLQYYSPSRDHEYDKLFQSKMLVRDWVGQGTYQISLSRNGIYEIAFDAEVHHRLSRSNKPCLQPGRPVPDKWLYSAAATCENVCVTKERVRHHCVACLNIEMVDFLDLKMHEARPCSRLKSTRSTGRNKSGGLLLDPESGSTTCSISDSRLAAAAEACDAECVPQCEQWVFKSAVNMLSDMSSDSSVVTWITYNPIDGILSFEEVPTYTVDTFVSNVGGQLALWLGISAISVVQLMYYFGRACGRALTAEH